MTINYGHQREGRDAKESKNITQAELDDASNPWNSNLNEGMPPTAINNPGRTALDASVNPVEGDWIYFVAIDKKGNSAFAATNAEHERNIQTAIANGVL